MYDWVMAFELESSENLHLVKFRIRIVEDGDGICVERLIL